MQSETDQHQRIQAQYSKNSGAEFYRCVMGDGGFDVHYGIYGKSTSMQAATRESTSQLLAMARHALAGGPLQHVVDLGSGRGGAAHLIAQATNAHVTCVDLCDHHHVDNVAQAEKLGIGDRIRALQCPFEQLPSEYSVQFDLAWSQESICHSEDCRQVFDEAFRVLRPGGVFVLSDILLSESATPEQSSAFTKVNAVTRLSTEREYLDHLRDAGFELISTEDWTRYLVANFENMLSKMERHRDQLVETGIDSEHIDRFANALRQRLAWPPGTVLRWVAFCCRKPHRDADY